MESKRIVKNQTCLESGATFTVEVQIDERGSEFIQSYLTYADNVQGIISSTTTEQSKPLSGSVHVQKYVSPHPSAGDCYGPAYGECVDQELIKCVYSGDKRGAEDYIARNCRDASGKPKKC